MGDPKLKTGSNFCKCSACGEYFTSATPFDMHRRGEPVARRCLSAKEMKKRGMSRNKDGYWRKSARPSATLPPAPGQPDRPL